MSQDLSNLHGLLTLSRRDGIDVRPTLLRVLTDLYVQEAHHTSDERRRFMELASRMLDHADEATRQLVAEKLAHCADAPPALILRLANEPTSISAPVLEYSPLLSEDELISLVETHGASHATSIAKRRDLSARLTRRLSSLTSAGLDRALDMLDNFSAHLAADPLSPVPAPVPDRLPGIVPEAPISVKLEPIVDAPPTQPRMSDPATDPVRFAASLLDRPDVSPADLAPAFLLAAPEQRRRILADLARGQRAEMEPMSPTAVAQASRRLQGAALSQRAGEFALTLERTLGLPPAIVRDILADVDGEAMMIALKAIGIGADVTLRVLLFLDPALGRSVEKVFALAALYEDLDPRIARRMVAVWRGAFTPSLAARLAAPAPHAPQTMVTRRETAPVRPALAKPATGTLQSQMGWSLTAKPQQALLKHALVAKATSKPSS